MTQSKDTFQPIKIGQWRRDGFTFIVREEPGHPSGTVLCEIQYRGVGAPKPETVAMPVSRVLKAEIVDAS